MDKSGAATPVDTARSCDVCIVTFNSAQTVGQLVRSLDEEPCVASIRILDNASTDRTLGAIDETADGLTVPLSVEASPSNTGFSAAVNHLLKGSTADVVAVVNPDIELTSGALSRLVETVLSDTSIGIASCRLTTRDGRAQSEPARARPRLHRLLAGYVPRRVGSTMASHRRGSAGLFADRDVECTSGALMVLRRDLLEKVGYLDESVFMYLEDIDFSARVRAAGYRIRYLGTTWVWHDSGASALQQSWLNSFLPKVWITYLRRYGCRYERFAARPILLVVCLIEALKRLRRREFPHGELLARWHVLSFRPAKAPVWS